MRELTSVVWMACKDLRHDIRMSICLILTVAAIALPLLLFFGLKNGVVEVMRQRMINDPSYMEIIPQGAETLDANWFERWRNNKHVGFVVPKTRELGVGGTFINPTHSAKPVKADMQPTGSGDWLLQSYAMRIPQEGSCVLTTSLAQKLQIKKNETVEIRIFRQKKSGGLEAASLKLLVLDILPQQASGRNMAFVPLIQLEHIEAFRDGFGVEAYDWKGEKPLAYPVFYEGLLYTRKPLSPVAIAQLRQRTGFAQIVEVDVDTSKGWHVLRLEAGNNALSLFKVQEIRNILRGQEMAFVPMAGRTDDDFTVSFEDESAMQASKKLSPLKLTASALWSSAAWEDIRPSESTLAATWNNVQKTPNVLLVSPATAAQFAHKTIATIHTPAGASLRLPVYILAHAQISDNTVNAAPGLVAKLNLLQTRPLVEANSTSHVKLGEDLNLILGRQTYSRFRMYARSLDDVAPLAAQLESEGVIVKTRVAEIERVRKMDQYLSLILGIIAGAAVVGGTICLLASLYASVERKRRSLAVLRLLGIHGTTLCAFPLTGGVVMTGLGMLLALGLFHAIGSYMNFMAQGFILQGEVLCKLGFSQQLWAILWAMLSSVLAGLAASLRLLKIEAAESLRDE